MGFWVKNLLQFPDIPIANRLTKYLGVMNGVEHLWRRNPRLNSAQCPPHGSSQLLRENMKRFRGGLVFEAHRLFASLNSRLESIEEEEKGSSHQLSREKSTHRQKSTHRPSSGSISQSQTERGHGPIIVLVMAPVRQNGESFFINAVTSNQ